MYWYNFLLFLNTVVIGFLVYRNYKLRTVLKQALIDNTLAIAMMSSMKENLENSQNDLNIANDDFVKFLSDSREWAFDYIENTINVINEVIEECRNEMNKPRIADLNTPAFLAGIIGKLRPIVEDNKGSKGV